jgi:hypothetical protein
MTTHADTPETESDGGQASGRAHRAESCMSMRVRQMSYDHLCALLRGVCWTVRMPALVLRMGSGLASTGAAATKPDGTDVLSAIAADPPADPSQTPAVPRQSSHRSAGAGRPDPDHGGTGDDPHGLRSRRGPPEDPRPPHSGGSPLFTGGMTWLS